MKIGDISTDLPYIKTNAVFALTQPYANKTMALEGIASYLAGKYPNQKSVRPAITAVQQIYEGNFFPEMKANWRAYPNNIGHKDWPGCFRCHDGKHMSTDGKRAIKADDCNACHTILAQGNGKDLDELTPKGQEFKHPGDELEKGFLCNDCHSGGP
jgi:hypothetical protein